MNPRNAVVDNVHGVYTQLCKIPPVSFPSFQVKATSAAVLRVPPEAGQSALLGVARLFSQQLGRN